MIFVIFNFGFCALAFILSPQLMFNVSMQVCASVKNCLCIYNVCLIFLMHAMKEKIVRYSKCIQIKINFIITSHINFIFIKITFFEVWMSAILCYGSLITRTYLRYFTYKLILTFVSVGKVPVFCVSVAQQHILRASLAFL